jgi:hypothetical protein
MAIEDDRQPMVEALCRLDALRAVELNLRMATGCQVSTQVALLGGGWLDLVLEVLDARRRVIGEVWVEDKIDAPESGLGQLRYYQECAQRRALERGYAVWLVTLSRDALPGTNVPNLSWNVLYQCARHGRSDRRSWKQHASWQDLGTFLEEQNVANDALGPISDHDAASLEPAYELLQKVSALITAVHRRLPDLFPEPVASKLHWPNEGQLLNFVGANFRSTGEMVGTGGPLRYGLMAQGGTAYWEVAVDGRYSAKDTIEPARTKADTVQPPFGVDWERPPSGPSILVARTRATALQTHEAARAWFEARLREVAVSGVVETLLRGGPLAPPELVARSESSDAVHGETAE